MAKPLTTRVRSRRSRALKIDPAAPLREGDQRFPLAVRILARHRQISIHHAAALAAVWGFPVEEAV
jgi:hypothetical protein